jgi:hypothetical protein
MIRNNTLASARRTAITKAHVPLLGTMPDRDLAEMIGCTENTVAKARKKLGILPNLPSRRQPPAVDPRSLQRRLSDWPHRLAGVGVDANYLIESLIKAPNGLTITECRTLTRSHPLGALTRHGLAVLAETTPQTRYKITAKGQHYHTLLQHHNLIPPHP